MEMEAPPPVAQFRRPKRSQPAWKQSPTSVIKEKRAAGQRSPARAKREEEEQQDEREGATRKRTTSRQSCCSVSGPDQKQGRRLSASSERSQQEG